MIQAKNAYLVLETGEVYPGQWFESPGYACPDRAGEVVFNTSHSGYEEIATDPSYMNQIVVLTTSQMGNYGVSKSFWESRRIWIEGFVCLQIQNSARDFSWIQRLSENGVPLMAGMDTRALAFRLRSGGTPWGALVKAQSPELAQSKAMALIAKQKNQDKDWVFAASRKERQVRPGKNKNGPKVAVLDFGAKENILRLLEQNCRELVLLNSRTSTDEVLAVQADFVMLTNGPGDPADVQVAVQTVKSLLGKIPVFGICMGHQVLSLALGAKTYKLAFGHRGSNHPIQDKLLNRVYVTSQNHGYAVDAKTLPDEAKVTQVNLNDMTVAGIYCAEKKYLGIQYHPEACPGPHEAEQLFRFFIETTLGYKYAN